MTVLKSFVVWCAILVLAMLNGIFREAVLLPNLSKPGAYVVSSILLSLLILAVAVVFARWLKLGSTRQCLVIGLFWVSLTVVFEFGFGGLVQGRTWAEMLEAYTFKDGNLWPLVLVVTFLAPPVAFRVRRL